MAESGGSAEWVIDPGHRWNRVRRVDRPWETRDLLECDFFVLSSDSFYEAIFIASGSVI